MKKVASSWTQAISKVVFVLAVLAIFAIIAYHVISKLIVEFTGSEISAGNDEATTATLENSSETGQITNTALFITVSLTLLVMLGSGMMVYDSGYYENAKAGLQKSRSYVWRMWQWEFVRHADSLTDAIFDAVLEKEWRDAVRKGEKRRARDEKRPKWRRHFENSPQGSILSRDPVDHLTADQLKPAAADIQICGRDKLSETPTPQLFTIDPNTSADLHTWQFGQDAAGVSADCNLFVVADGIGGAPQSEIISHVLVRLVIRAYQLDPKRFDLVYTAKELMALCDRFLDLIPFIDGSSTLIIAHRDPTVRQLSVWSYGDSKAMLVGGSATDEFRKVTIGGTNDYFKLITIDIQYYPYSFHELSQTARNYSREIRLFRVNNYDHGDRLYVMSTGVADNIWPRTLAKMENAEQIVKMAVKNCAMPSSRSPYRSRMLHESGSKMDDMSLILVRL